MMHFSKLKATDISVNPFSARKRTNVYSNTIVILINAPALINAPPPFGKVKETKIPPNIT